MNKANQIRDLSIEEIESKIKELKEELFNIRFQVALGNAENPSKMNQLKRQIARMKTIITEKQKESSK